MLLRPADEGQMGARRSQRGPGGRLRPTQLAVQAAGQVRDAGVALVLVPVVLEGQGDAGQADPHEDDDENAAWKRFLKY